MSKYKAKRTTIDGITFASKAEAKRYEELKYMEMAGEIEWLELQPVFPLHATGFTEEGLTNIKIGKYVADFRYIDADSGREIIEDVKGFKTPLYKWKKKHAEAEHGVEIVEITSR